LTPSWRRQAGDSRMPDSRKWQCTCGHKWDGPFPECPRGETDPDHDHHVKRADAQQMVNSVGAEQEGNHADREQKGNPPDGAH
jgi:hypothetical protein